MRTADLQKRKTTQPPASRWHWASLTLCLIAIAMHFALRWAGLFHVVGMVAADIPLLSVIVIGGIPLALQILRKLLQGDFGADLLAVLALVTAAWLGEYLAAVLIILMRSGGDALESYAMRKASSVLLSLS